MVDVTQEEKIETFLNQFQNDQKSLYSLIV